MIVSAIFDSVDPELVAPILVKAVTRCHCLAIMTHISPRPAPEMAFSKLLGLLAGILILVCSAGVLRASSDDAWADFGKDVRAKMEKAVKANFTTYKITVDPHGTESYGVAVASGVSKYDKKPLTIVGIYDKKTMELEVVEFEGKKFGP